MPSGANTTKSITNMLDVEIWLRTFLSFHASWLETWVKERKAPVRH